MYIFSWNYIKEKWQHAGFQKYLKNMSWAFLGKVYGLIGSFFVGILVARYLGPEKYGVLNYVLSFVVVLAFLANFGIDNILVRDLVKFKENKDKILNIAINLSNTKVSVWAVTNDDDEVSAKKIIIAEAKVNAKYFKYGFYIDAMIMEKSDNYPVPNHYQKLV